VRRAQGGKKLLDVHIFNDFLPTQRGSESLKRNIYYRATLTGIRRKNAIMEKLEKEKRIKKAHRKVAFNSKEA